MDFSTIAPIVHQRLRKAEEELGLQLDEIPVEIIAASSYESFFTDNKQRQIVVVVETKIFQRLLAGIRGCAQLAIKHMQYDNRAHQYMRHGIRAHQCVFREFLAQSRASNETTFKVPEPYKLFVHPMKENKGFFNAFMVMERLEPDYECINDALEDTIKKRDTDRLLQIIQLFQSFASAYKARTYNFQHDDMHSGNILINLLEKKIAVLDFQLATVNKGMHDTYCDILLAWNSMWDFSFELDTKYKTSFEKYFYIETDVPGLDRFNAIVNKKFLQTSEDETLADCPWIPGWVIHTI